MWASPMAKLLPFTIAIGNICGELEDCICCHGRSICYPVTTTKIGQISGVGNKSKNPWLYEIHPIFNSVVVAAIDTWPGAPWQSPQPLASLEIITKTANTQQGATWGPGSHRATCLVLSRSLGWTQLGMCDFPSSRGFCFYPQCLIHTCQHIRNVRSHYEFQPKLRHYRQGRKIYDFGRKLWFYLISHLMVGQTTMYLVSLGSSTTMQENGV